MAKSQATSKVRRSYQFIQLHQDQYAVKTMCRFLNVTRSGYYAWLAVRRRRPKQTLIHSDQGSQHGSDDWRRFCKTNGLEPSMSRRGNCYDNAVAESFFSSLKKERIKKRIYKNRELAIADIAD
jgi:transposase InsO family protein